MKKLFPLIVVASLFGAGCSAQSDVQTNALQIPVIPVKSAASSTMPTETPPANNTAMEETSVTVNTQPAGMRTAIKSVISSKPGFIVIHEDANGKPGAVLGVSLLIQPGTMQDASVPVATKAGSSYWAVFHADNGDGMFKEAQDLAAQDEKGNIGSAKFSATK